MVLLATGTANATTYTHVPTIEESFAASSVVVHGQVSAVDSCEGSRAWTFISLQVNEVLRGSLSSGSTLQMSTTSSTLEADSTTLTEPASASCDPGAVEWSWDEPWAEPADDDGSRPPGPELIAGGCSVDLDWTASEGASEPSLLTVEQTTSSNTFTFRLPYGEYADGTRSTIVDTPGFSVGDEVVVFLTYDAQGDHLFMPLSWMAWSVYRVFRSGSGATAVVNGFGQTLHPRADQIPTTGPGDRDLRHLYWQDPPLDSALVGSALNDIASAATWSGSGLAEGPWRGRLRADVDGDGQSTCLANVAGLVDGNSLSLSGRCNADYSGSTLVDIVGTQSSGSWSGTVTFTPTALPNESRSASWSSTTALDDFLVGAATGTHQENGYSFTYDIAFRAGFVDARPLLSFSAFRSYLQQLAVEHAATAGTAQDIALDASTCSVTSPIVEVSQ